MHLVCILMFLAVQFDFWSVAEHVEGKANSLADDLSHDNFPHFFSQVSQAEHNKLLKFYHNSWTFWDTTISYIWNLQNGSSSSGILYNSSDSSDTQNL